MLRPNETEDPGNSSIELDSEKIYHGPGYWRKGNDYHFGATPQPNPPPRGSTGAGVTGSSALGGTGSISNRLMTAKVEQEARLDELEGKLQIYSDKTLSNLRAVARSCDPGSLLRLPQKSWRESSFARL